MCLDASKRTMQAVVTIRSTAYMRPSRHWLDQFVPQVWQFLNANHDSKTPKKIENCRHLPYMEVPAIGMRAPLIYGGACTFRFFFAFFVGLNFQVSHPKANQSMPKCKPGHLISIIILQIISDFFRFYSHRCLSMLECFASCEHTYGDVSVDCRTCMCVSMRIQRIESSWYA